MFHKIPLDVCIDLWRRVSLFTFALALAVCWIALDSAFSLRPVASRTVEIPDLCGMPVSDLPLADWMRVETSYRYDPDTPAGTVLSQYPLAGSFRKLSDDSPQCDLTLTVSLGEETQLMPDVIGYDVREASSLLRQTGFSVKTVSEFCSLPEGEVFSASRKAGEELPKGCEIVLYVAAHEE